MNYKKKIIALSIFLIISIQILLLLNNKQKTSFRYFVWNIEDVSIGRLICISFISGLLMSSILNKTLNNNVRTYLVNEVDNKINTNNENSINEVDNNESHEVPPERDLRDTQPTISVNYRVIKDNSQNQFKDKDKVSRTNQYQDDWNKSDSEW